jgi:WD40 repeat protein
MKLRTLLLAAGLLALAPAAANADSIVYVDQGNVWSASPDGAHKVQLTSGGGWHSPTQADDGTIAAVQGTGPIHLMARDGRPLRTITTAPAKSADGGAFEARPVNLSLSPDGSKLAYSYLAYSCPVASSCGSIQRSTFYTHTDVTEATPIEVYGNQFSVGEPEWVNNSRTLVFGGYGSQVSIDDLGPGDYSHKAWMVPNGDMGDGELTRDGTRLAVTVDYGANTKIGFFAVTGEAGSAEPEPACTMTNPDERYGDPTWSPDGAGIAFESSKGIVVSRFTAFAPGVCEAPNDVLLSATGSEPDWGPADAPAAAHVPESGDTPQTPGAAAKLTLGKVTAQKLRKGLAVRVSVPAAGRVSVKATAGGRKVASGSANAKRAGTVTVRLSKARVRKGKTLTLKLTFNGQTVTKTAKVR